MEETAQYFEKCFFYNQISDFHLLARSVTINAKTTVHCTPGSSVGRMNGAFYSNGTYRHMYNTYMCQNQRKYSPLKLFANANRKEPSAMNGPRGNSNIYFPWHAERNLENICVRKVWKRFS
jgi:hypothetical protein